MSPRLPIAITLTCLAARLALAGFTDVYPDEAYYWTWSQHLQLAYFDHPALIAWSIALFGMRVGAALWGLATLAGVFRLATELGGDRVTAWWATALFASTPAANVLATFATPDAPLLAFWVWTLVALARRNVVAVGLLWGLAMLSKYNGVLLGLPVLLVFWRAPLKLIAAGLLALVVTSPTIAWNALNDWEGFRFQLAHGLGGGGGLATFGEFLAGQVGMAGPVLLGLMGFWLVRGGRQPVLKAAAVIPVLFFGYASLKARGEANWSSAAWLSASVGVALLPGLRWKVVASVVNVVVVVAGTAFLSFPPASALGAQPVRKLHGWSILSRAAETRVPVITNKYQLSAMTTWYSGMPATTFAGRRSQYDLWPVPDGLRLGADALWIGEWEGPPAELAEKFESTTDLTWEQDARQSVLHKYHVFRLNKLVAPLR